MHQGFTLVELVMVMILVGILGSVGVGLFASSDIYAPGAARDQFIASALLAQKRALAHVSGEPVQLSLQADAQQWQFQVAQNGITFSERTADRKGASLTVSGGSFPVSFDSRSRTGGNITLRFGAAVACLSSTGFAYAGECQP